MPPDDRDQLKRITPPAGIQSQLAPEDGFPRHKRHLTPIEGIEEREEAMEPSLAGIDRRTKETKNSSLTTLNMVETLRKETREDVKELHKKFDTLSRDVNTKYDNVNATLAKVSTGLARQEGQNNQILLALTEQAKDRDAKRTVHTHASVKQLDVDTTRQLTDIEVEAAERKARIEVKKKRDLKIIAIIGALVSALIGGIGLLQC